MGKGALKVERDGWLIDIQTLEVCQRPHWEIRCRIQRKKQGQVEERSHRFFVTEDLGNHLKLDALSEARREERLVRAAKNVILRELDEIFSEPEGGLDSLRPLTEKDLLAS